MKPHQRRTGTPLHARIHPRTELELRIHLCKDILYFKEIPVLLEKGAKRHKKAPMLKPGLLCNQHEQQGLKQRLARQGHKCAGYNPQ
jgi:hypothetical protein